MESNENIPVELMTFVRLLIDENRLRIIGLLAQRASSIEQLAAILKLRPAIVSHHLNKLVEAELVRSNATSGPMLYELRIDTLHAMARRWLAVESPPNVAVELTGDSYDRKVMTDFMGRDGRLKEIPAQQKKRDVVLRHILSEFQFGERYGEKQVNDIIRRFHDDTATLRRALVDYGWLQRAHGVYWREE